MPCSAAKDIYVAQCMLSPCTLRSIVCIHYIESLIFVVLVDDNSTIRILEIDLAGCTKVAIMIGEKICNEGNLSSGSSITFGHPCEMSQ